MVAPGSLPSLRISSTPALSGTASAAANRKPRASIPATRSIEPIVAAAIRSTHCARPCASSSNVVMSRNMIPGFGKSGIVRISAFRSSLAEGASVSVLNVAPDILIGSPCQEAEDQQEEAGSEARRVARREVGFSRPHQEGGDVLGHLV